MFIRTIFTSGNGSSLFNNLKQVIMKKIIRNYQIFMLFQGLAISFFFGTYQLFLVQKGLSLLEINLLNCGFMVANFIFEIPTGAIADFFGRKKSVIIGLSIYAFSFLVYFFASSFWYFLIAEILGALAATCVSGALESLAVDEIYEKGAQHDADALFRKAEIRNIGVLIGVIIGSYLGQFNLALPWILSSITFAFLAVLTNFLFKEQRNTVITEKDVTSTRIKQIAKDSVIYGLKNRRLMLGVSFAAILAFSFQAVNMYWPIVFKENFDLPVKYMGFIFAGVVLSTYGASQLSKWWQSRISCEKKAIFFSQIFTLLGLIGCYFFLDLSSFLVFFLLHEAGRGLFNPLYRSYVNKSIDDKNRATVLSFESMIVKGGAGLGLIVSGFLADSLGILNTWLIVSLILALGIICFWFKNK